MLVLGGGHRALEGNCGSFSILQGLIALNGNFNSLDLHVPLGMVVFLQEFGLSKTFSNNLLQQQNLATDFQQIKVNNIGESRLRLFFALRECLIFLYLLDELP